MTRRIMACSTQQHSLVYQILQQNVSMPQLEGNIVLWKVLQEFKRPLQNRACAAILKSQVQLGEKWGGLHAKCTAALPLHVHLSYAKGACACILVPQTGSQRMLCSRLMEVSLYRPCEAAEEVLHPADEQDTSPHAGRSHSREGSPPAGQLVHSNASCWTPVNYAC